MPRATTGKVHHRRQRKVLKDVKGFRGGRSVLYRTAKDARRKALQNSYIDRKRKKREFRSIWITRIGIASDLCGISYSKLINALKTKNVLLDRKMLADIAVKDFKTFQAIVKQITV